jgi:hypothetical protein
MSKRKNLYVGRAGQMAVMAELLWRGWNVALPEVDVGDDVLVVKDDSGDLWRIQVKTATAQPQQDGYSAQFRISLRQLRTSRTPDLIYIFAMRSITGWEPFVIMDRDTLRLEHEIHGVGSVSADHVVLRLVSSRSSLWCSRRDFQPYRSDWSRWPVIPH